MNRYILMVLAGACSFGMLSTFVKLAYRKGYGTFELAFSQALAGMLVLWLLVAIRRLRRRTPLPTAPKQIFGGIGTGLTIGWTTYVYYLSVQYIPASLAIVLLMQFTWLGPLAGALFLKARLRPTQVLLIAVLLAGTWLASGWSTGAGPFSARGILLALLAAVLYTVYILANSGTGKTTDALTRSALIMTGSALGILLVNIPVLSGVEIGTPGLPAYALFLAFFGTILPPLLFAKAIPETGPVTAAVLLTAELPVAVICAHLFLGEPLGALQWFGCILMLIAVAALEVVKK